MFEYLLYSKYGTRKVCPFPSLPLHTSLCRGHDYRRNYKNEAKQNNTADQRGSRPPGWTAVRAERGRVQTQSSGPCRRIWNPLNTYILRCDLILQGEGEGYSFSERSGSFPQAKQVPHAAGSQSRLHIGIAGGLQKKKNPEYRAPTPEVLISLVWGHRLTGAFYDIPRVLLLSGQGWAPLTSVHRTRG